MLGFLKIIIYKSYVKFRLSYKQYVCLFSNLMFRIIQSTQNVLSIQNILIF